MAPSLFWYTRRMLFFSCYFIPFVVCTFHISYSRHPHLSNTSDQEALLGFRSKITYDPTQSLPTTWNPNVSFCRWTGIVCSRRRQRVLSLNASNMGLQGTISPLLGNLSFLRFLDLGLNNLQGPIPYELGNLFRLEKLYLDDNHLQGFIPPTLGRCRRLRFFSLGMNNLKGNIPSELCVLSKVQFFNLEHNNLTGTIPACLGNLSSSKYIYLDENNLHGIVPPELGMLSNEINIVLHRNHLTGPIPSSLSNCTNLLALDISQNQLTGHIPGDLCNKNSGLLILYLDANQLSGSIPASLFNCTNLQGISLSINHLSGLVPTELGKLKQLYALMLGGNQLVSGSTTTLPFLLALTNCSTLQDIDLSYNYLTGRLPSSIGQLSTNLYHIDFGTNGLVGEIPSQIGNLTALTYLSLENNLFTGPIPSSIKMLQKLQQLYVGFNNLEGNIPAEIGQLQSLGELYLGGNNISGKIPESFASLHQLRYLELAHNQLSGNIPPSLGKCVNLLKIDLSYNKLTGEIPPEFSGLANLAFYFNLSNNFLTGPLPLELSKMTMLPAIDISANQLTGYIPSELRRCRELEYLNLSCNSLEGPIPISLSELQSLKDVDFSSNNLSGGIPVSLANLKMLKHLNLSFNNLLGEVPKGGVFKKLSATAFMGNPGLCGPPVSLSPCPALKHKSASHLKNVFIAIVAVPVVLVLCLLLGILCRRNHKRHIQGASLNMGLRRISYRELINATNNFSDANLLGVGSFGKVYKGILNDGTLVAVKLLNLESEGAHKSFDRECQVLGRVRHRNLIRIITSYSDLQTKALIFPLMPNGSLEKWLYPNDSEESNLTLIQRLNIAIDIAQGMAYLHHQCFVQVIHCDLKPSNVLLGEDMTAYLIDFGIATICFANYEDSSFTSTHALKGSTGYIPPEYGLGGHVTTKGDVYSYGIMLLEMLTRKKPTHNMFVEGMNLQKWVGNGFPNQVGEVLDKSLLKRTSTITEQDKDLDCLIQCISVGLLCTKDSPQERPTMMDIVSRLQCIQDAFLGVVGIPKFQSNITYLLDNTSTTCNNAGEGQSSSTF